MRCDDSEVNRSLATVWCFVACATGIFTIISTSHGDVNQALLFSACNSQNLGNGLRDKTNLDIVQFPHQFINQCSCLLGTDHHNNLIKTCTGLYISMLAVINNLKW